ncbi:hypothetical protein GUJ93_ZPchr0001g33191 [Zizania palustris]|uniref:Uncharacterized protein n=1 Tax=Zizania palustris TaxID=103762 RepID=A0A8J5RLH0_ZIZPA|nr:hypothetical protein GUJ93_ZPchr0001g33191 [Zizania palustris]
MDILHNPCKYPISEILKNNHIKGQMVCIFTGETFNFQFYDLAAISVLICDINIRDYMTWAANEHGMFQCFIQTLTSWVDGKHNTNVAFSYHGKYNTKATMIFKICCAT